ncbi:MAG: hypothetical protein ACKOET_09785 [Verrucomicrobiota bacterium]
MRVRILHFSPGTATPRHDSQRAGLGFAAFLHEAFGQAGVAGTLEWCWGLPALVDGPAVHRQLSGADLLVVVTPTYAQGSPWFVRRYFELGVGLQLWGTLGTALATAGGVHTGGEVAVSDTLRSLQGLGCCTFGFAQKQVVLGAQQKLAPDGEFDLVDAWFLRQLARTCVVQGLARRDPAAARARAGPWQVDTAYYRHFPAAERLRWEVGPVRRRMNRAQAGGWRACARWARELGFELPPERPETLPFAPLLPKELPTPPPPGPPDGG